MTQLSEACERNKGPILEVLGQELLSCRRLLEIGSGTGQHAAWFARQLPHVHWIPSELPRFQHQLQHYLAEHLTRNLAVPVALDVSDERWPTITVDTIFTANTLHIMSWPHVVALFANLSQVLEESARLCVYGPFRYANQHTSESNARFDVWLKNRDPLSGVRDFEAVDELARAAGLALREDHSMPANNQLLIWER